MTHANRRKVLISGASIAGPALAYWLHRYGFEVTVVEKSDKVRGGGYPIDIRGTALEVVDRMGLLPELAAAHIDTRRLTFLDGDGGLIASLRAETLTGGEDGRDIELPRGDLTAALYAAVRDDVEFRFDDSIETLVDHDGGVDVTFRSGLARSFDLVVGADGLHSNTRRLILGPEEQFHRYLGYCFAGFTMPNHLGLSHEGVTSTTPGRTAALYAAGDSDVVHGFLTFVRSDPPFHAFARPDLQRELVASVFADAGWEAPRMVAAMRASDDLYFDVVSQIHLPRWSKGRVVLVGDAAYAPSFLSGQGTSISLVGAYVLAGELASRADHTAAFDAYEREARGFVELNQGLVGDGGTMLLPKTAEQFESRNEKLRAAQAAEPLGEEGQPAPAELPGDPRRSVHTAITLVDYAAA